jgi:hypothetical protein
MILVVWSVAFLVCIAPLLGWKDPEWWTRVSEERECLVSQDVGYQIFATASSFYLPLLVILFLYWRIFQTARKRIRRRVTASAGCSAAGAGAVRNPAAGGVIAGAAGKAVRINCECYLWIYIQVNRYILHSHLFSSISSLHWKMLASAGDASYVLRY